MISLWIDKEGRQMSESDIRAAHPLTVWPAVFCPFDDYAPVHDGPTPEFDPMTHELVWGEPVLIDGQWRREATAAPLAPEVAAERRRALVPQVVSRAQGKVALMQAGLWPSVLEFVAAIAEPLEKFKADVALNDAQEWQRDSVFLTTAAAALGLDDEQLDALFVAAGAVRL